MPGRHLAVAAVAGVVAFAAAFGIAKAGSGSRETPKAKAADPAAKVVILRQVDVGTAKVQGVGTGGQLARFKSPKPKQQKSSTSSGSNGSGGSTTPSSSATAVPTTNATPAPTSNATPQPTTQATPAPTEEGGTGSGNDVVGGSG